MKSIFLLLVIVFSNNVNSQSEKGSNLDDTITIYSECIDLFPDIEASFIGGAAALQKYISEKIVYDNYDSEPLDSRIYIEFIVDKDGSVMNPKIIKGFDEKSNEKYLAIIQNMPKWKPAETNGVPVKSLARIPIVICFN